MPKSRAHLLLMAVITVVLAVILPNIASAEPDASARKEIKVLKKHIHKSTTTVAFWKNRGKGRWALHLSYKKCGNVYGEQRRKVCHKARESLRSHARRLKDARTRLVVLVAPADMGYLPENKARKLGRQMAARAGWSGSQWRCLDSLWGDYESSWRVKADNPHSEAYGIPQALPGSKMGPGWQTSAYVQIKWGLGYVRARFGNPCSALAFRKANGWY